MTRAQRAARKPRQRTIGCNGKMLWRDDGNAWMCSRCAKVFRRTRMNPYPDTTHAMTRSKPHV